MDTGEKESGSAAVPGGAGTRHRRSRRGPRHGASGSRRPGPMAQADLQAIRAAGRVLRLYMPQAVLWGRQVLSRSYLPAPRDRVQLMDDVYQVITSASRHAAQTLGALVIDTAAPSRAVALARIAVPAASGPSIDPGLDLDTLGPRLRSFGRRRDWQVTRVDDLDAQAVVDAYQGQHLTLPQCALRLATSEHLITVVLKNNDIPLRPAPKTPPPPAAAESQAHGPAAPANPAPARRRAGSVEGRLQALGITDPSLLVRAAALDRAGRELLAQAATETAAEKTGPARLAAKDTPHSSQATEPDPGGRSTDRSSTRIRRLPRRKGPTA